MRFITYFAIVSAVIAADCNYSDGSAISSSTYYMQSCIKNVRDSQSLEEPLRACYKSSGAKISDSCLNCIVPPMDALGKKLKACTTLSCQNESESEFKESMIVCGSSKSSRVVSCTVGILLLLAAIL